MAILELKNAVTELRTLVLDLMMDYKQKRELANWKIDPLENKQTNKTKKNSDWSTEKQSLGRVKEIYSK